MNLDESIFERVKEEYPERLFEFSIVDTSDKYNILETLMDNKILFRNIINNKDEEDYDEEDIVSKLFKTIIEQDRIYKKLDRLQVVKEQKTIMFMNMVEPTSFHKLTEKELAQKIAEYEISKEELIKKDETKVHNS